MRSLATSQPFAAATPAPIPEVDPAEKNREWSISEMAKHFGVTLRTLRFYESRGLISPQRFGGARYYSQRDRSRLKLVLAAKQMGFTLTETAAMLGNQAETEAGDLPLSTGTVQSQIEFLENQRMAIEAALATLRGRLSEMARP